MQYIDQLVCTEHSLPFYMYNRKNIKCEIKRSGWWLELYYKGLHLTPVQFITCHSSKMDDKLYSNLLKYASSLNGVNIMKKFK